MQQGSGRERAYAYLRDRLLTDSRLAGTFINESEIADAAGVSRTPVREALLMLATEGLVQLVPHRGAYVAPLTPDQIRDILQARDAIETWAVRTTLAAGTAPVQTMRDCLTRQAKLLDPQQNREFIEADSEFHATLIAASGNTMMERLYETLRARHVHIGVSAVASSHSRRQAVLDEHRAIVDALATGDVDAAEAAVTTHLEATRRMLVNDH